MTSEQKNQLPEEHRELFTATMAEIKRASECFIESVIKRVRRRIGVSKLTEAQIAIVHAVIRGVSTANKKKGANNE